MQATVTLFISSMELFKCYMQNKTFRSSYHGNSFIKRERARERDGNGDREREKGGEIERDVKRGLSPIPLTLAFSIHVCSWTSVYVCVGQAEKQGVMFSVKDGEVHRGQLVLR